MGTYTDFSVDGYELVMSKSAVVSAVMTLFREYDHKIIKRNISNDLSSCEFEPEENLEEVIIYSTTVKHACHRLDVMGFTLERSKREYERIRVEELEQLLANSQESVGPDFSEYIIREIELLELLTFENYVSSFQSILRLGHKIYELKSAQLSMLDKISQYILDEQQDEWFYFGFFCKDVRFFLRMALSLMPAEAEVVQDISELVSGGWYTSTQPVCDEAIHTLVERYPENAPRIILTEGSSDADILNKALSVIFPHMSGYYTFFDFHGSKAGGGASQLVSVVKAFAAAGIANRVIAVLDNDTAGREALRALKDVVLPDNIAIIHYPLREWMKSYPTLGPSGNVLLDVNGTAASIELYLGCDVLNQGGHLCPVQWAGYSQSLKSYQGELLDKTGIVERWRGKASRCLADASQVIDADWADMRAIWLSIFSAFPDASFQLET